VKAQIESTNRKLMLEKKVKQAAESLHRLETAANKWQPESVSPTAHVHLGEAQKKCDDITAEVWRLTSVEMDLERKLLNHNAAVLSLGMNILEKKIVEPSDDFGEGHLYLSFEDDVRSLKKHDSMEKLPTTNGDSAEVLEAQNRLRELNFRVATLARADISPSPQETLVSYIDQLKSNIQTLTAYHTSTSRDLQSSLSDSQRMVEQLKLRERDQSDAIVKKTAQTEDLDRRLVHTQREFDRVQNELEEKNEQIARLEGEIDSLREEAQIAESAAQGRENESLMMERSLRKGDVDRLTAEIHVKEKKVAELEGQVEGLQGALDTTKKDLAAMQRSLDEATRAHNATLRELEAQVIALKSETASLKAEKDEIAGSRQQRAEELRLQREFDLAKERQAGEVHANEALSQELQTLRTQNAKLLSSLETSESKRKSVEDRLTTQLSSLQVSLSEAESFRPLPSAFTDALQVRALESRCADLHSELTSLLDDFERLTSQFIDHESQRQSLEAQIDFMRDQVHNLQSELALERVKTLGKGAGEEQTSTTTLRSEFRKMVAEMRAEHLGALKVLSMWLG
jgi:chromosome segregation ATPase